MTNQAKPAKFQPKSKKKEHKSELKCYNNKLNTQKPHQTGESIYY